MFGDLMSNMQNQQEELQKKLKSLSVDTFYEGVRISGNATKKVTNISIDNELMDDKEMLEDLLLVTFNKFLAQASQIEANEAQNAMKDMLPPGFENLFGA